MGYQIKNSNQFASWEPGQYLSPSDVLIGQPGSNLPSSQDSAISDDTLIDVDIILRRNNFGDDNKPKAYKTPKQILNLSYEK